MYIDFHSHILPEMDDGANTVEVALEMVNLEYKHHVDTIVLTPHFYNNEESVESFINRRKASFIMLQEHKTSLPPIDYRLGAEVYLSKKISHTLDLEKLCIEGTNYLLVEMPYESISEWMIHEIEEIICKRSIRLFFAHIDRYLSIYKKRELDLLLSIDNAVFQVNNESLETRKGLKLIKYFQRNQISFVLGSDAHNMKNRAPNFNKVSRV